MSILFEPIAIKGMELNRVQCMQEAKGKKEMRM